MNSHIQKRSLRYFGAESPEAILLNQRTALIVLFRPLESLDVPVKRFILVRPVWAIVRR
jgi:hypothetical protein